MHVWYSLGHELRSRTKASPWPCRYFLNSKCAWYAKTFEGTFEISMTCLVVFSILVRA